METGNRVEELTKNWPSSSIEEFENHPGNGNTENGLNSLNCEEELMKVAQECIQNSELLHSKNHILDPPSESSSDFFKHTSKLSTFPTLEPILEGDEEHNPIKDQHLEESNRQPSESRFPMELNEAKLLIYQDNAQDFLKKVEKGPLCPEDASLDSGESNAGANKNFVLEYLFQYACEVDAVQCAKCIAEDICHWIPTQMNVRNAQGWTALHFAAYSGSIKCLDFLLESGGADVDDSFIPHGSPLEISIFKSCSSIHSKLGDAWSDSMPIEEFLKFIQEADLSSVRLLSNKSRKLVDLAFEFASDGDLTALAVLLNIHAKLVNACDSNLDKYITLTDHLVNLAILSREKDIIKCKEESTLDWSSRKLILKELELILKWKPDLEGKSWLGKAYAPPLVKAAEAKDEQVLSLLVDSGAPVNASDFDGNTPLHACILSKNENIDSSQIVFKLVKHNAKVSISNKLEATPLHFAAEFGQLNSAKVINPT